MNFMELEREFSERSANFACGRSWFNAQHFIVSAQFGLKKKKFH